MSPAAATPTWRAWWWRARARFAPPVVLPRSDHGSGTVLVLAVVAVALALATTLAGLGQVVAGRAQAQTAADLAALAAATRLRTSADVDASCDLAHEVAVRNGATLTGCRHEGGGAMVVTVGVRTTFGTATAEARAGPSSARQALPSSGGRQTRQAQVRPAGRARPVGKAGDPSQPPVYDCLTSVLHSRRRVMAPTTSRLSSKGQIVLPAQLRRTHRWGPGTQFRVEDTPGGILLVPLNKEGSTTVDDVAGCLTYSGPPVSVAQMDEAVARSAKERHARGRY